MSRYVRDGTPILEGTSLGVDRRQATCRKIIRICAKPVKPGKRQAERGARGPGHVEPTNSACVQAVEALFDPGSRIGKGQSGGVVLLPVCLCQEGHGAGDERARGEACARERHGQNGKAKGEFARG